MDRVIYFLTILLLSISNSFGQVNNKITQLKIGDAIPTDLLKLDLEVINQPEGKPIVQLTDYKDKLVILDFWATWCSSCIGVMPRIHEVQRQFNKDLVVIGVTYQAKKIVVDYILENKILSQLKPISIVADTTLKKYFPHQLIPHYVWLYNGKVIQITGPNAIVNDNIKAVLDGKSLAVRSKIDNTVFKRDLPLLENKSVGEGSILLYNSRLTKYISGLGSIEGIKNDTVGNTKRYYFINRPILAIYMDMAYNAYSYTNRVILEVSRPERFIKTDKLSDDWDFLNSYCYELTVPMNCSKEKVKQMMLDDLDRYLNIRTRVEMRMVDCFVIVAAKATKISQTYVDSTHVKTDFETNLNSQIPTLPFRPIIIDESSYKGKFDLPPGYKGDLVSLAKHIEAYGLKIIPTKRNLQVLVFSDQR